MVSCFVVDYADNVQAPRFVTQPSASASIVSEGRAKFLQCQAVGKSFWNTQKLKNLNEPPGTLESIFSLDDWNIESDTAAVEHEKWGKQ